MNETPKNLLKAMETYSEVHYKMANDPALTEAQLKYDQAVAPLLAKFEMAKRFLDAVDHVREGYLSDLNEVENYIKAQVMELGRSVTHNDVKAAHRSGYERVTWDNKKITSLIMANPALAQIIAPARKVTEVAPNVSVSINPVASDIETQSAEEEPELPF